MDKNFIGVFDKISAALFKDTRCIGGWHMGSFGRGEHDEYSDFDLVFASESEGFASLAADMRGIIEASCDEIVLFGTEFDESKHYRRFHAAIRAGGNIHSLDVFLMGRVCFKDDVTLVLYVDGNTTDSIIFDKTGEIAEIFKSSYIPSINLSPRRLQDSYWINLMASVKHLKRGEDGIFKLIRIMRQMAYCHACVLLLHRGTNMIFNAWVFPVIKYVPREKWPSLTAYYAPANAASFAAALRKCAAAFESDAREVYAGLGIDYPEATSRRILAYFDKHMGSVCHE